MSHTVSYLNSKSVQNSFIRVEEFSQVSKRGTAPLLKIIPIVAAKHIHIYVFEFTIFSQEL